MKKHAPYKTTATGVRIPRHKIKRMASPSKVPKDSLDDLIFPPYDLHPIFLPTPRSSSKLEKEPIFETKERMEL